MWWTTTNDVAFNIFSVFFLGSHLCSPVEFVLCVVKIYLSKTTMAGVFSSGTDCLYTLLSSILNVQKQIDMKSLERIERWWDEQKRNEILSEQTWPTSYERLFFNLHRTKKRHTYLQINTPSKFSGIFSLGSAIKNRKWTKSIKKKIQRKWNVRKHRIKIKLWTVVLNTAVETLSISWDWNWKLSVTVCTYLFFCPIFFFGGASIFTCLLSTTVWFTQWKVFVWCDKFQLERSDGGAVKFAVK